MPRPSRLTLSPWSIVALVLVLGAGACGDRGSGRSPATEAAAPDTAATPEQGPDTAISTPGAGSLRGAPGATAGRDTTSRAASSASGTPGAAAAQPAPAATSSKADTSAEAKAAALDSLHPFMPVTITLEVPPTPSRPRVLESVRAARHAGYERIVFQMGGDTLPGYRIAYVESPVKACGSGRRVSLSGEAVLLVRLDPAQAHDDAGQSTIDERSRKPGFPVLKQMVLTCDFEGQVHWALGLDRRAPFRVLKLDHPARLVLDLQEGAP